MILGVIRENETEERWTLLEDSDEPVVVVGDTVLCSAGFVGVERPDPEKEGLEDDEEEPKDDSDEDAVFVTLPEPLVVAETLSVDDMPAFGSD